MSHTHHHTRVRCARPWSREDAWARRLTARALRRAARAWLRSDTEARPAPIARGTEGRLTH